MGGLNKGTAPRRSARSRTGRKAIPRSRTNISKCRPRNETLNRIEWTATLPLEPGFYWFRGLLGRKGDKSAGEVVLVLPTAINKNIPAHVIVLGRNNKYGLHSCNGQWAGPLKSPGSC